MSIDFEGCLDPTKNPVDVNLDEPVRANARLILASSLTTKGNPHRLYYVVETDNLGHWKNHKLVSVKWPNQNTLNAISAYNRGENPGGIGVPKILR